MATFIDVCDKRIPVFRFNEELASTLQWRIVVRSTASAKTLPDNPRDQIKAKKYLRNVQDTLFVHGYKLFEAMISPHDAIFIVQA